MEKMNKGSRENPTSEDALLASGPSPPGNNWSGSPVTGVGVWTRMDSGYLEVFVTLSDVAQAVTRVSGWPGARCGLAASAF